MISRDEQKKILTGKIPEEILDALERASRNVLDIDPEGGKRYFIDSFRRKRKSDPQRGT
jgi:hypothetical protein